MDFSQCQTPPPRNCVSSTNLMFPSTGSYSHDGSFPSFSVSDDELASGGGGGGNNNTPLIFNNKQIKFKSTADILSDTFEDEYGTDSDYLSSEDENDFNHNLDLNLNSNKNIERNLKLLQQKKKKKKKKTNGKKDKDKDKDNDKDNDTIKQRTRAFSSTSTTDSYLKLPINESDDNYEESMTDINKLNLPQKNTKLHLRSFSESNIHRDIQNNQWPSSEDESDDALNNANRQNLTHEQKMKLRYMQIKKKYKKQRRISRQFQNAITMIQDDNEDQFIATENQLREQLEKEYELKLIQLEHQKLNHHIQNEDKMKHIMSENEQLMLQNKQLQQQVAAQVAMIQQQQQMVAAQQHQSFVRMTSGDSIIHPPSNAMSPGSTIQSPLATLGGLSSVQFPSTPSTKNAFRRESSTSTINNIPALPFQNIPSDSNTINVATHTNLGLSKTKNGSSSSSSSRSGINGGPKTPSVASQDDNYTLNGIHITQFHQDDHDDDDHDDDQDEDEDEDEDDTSRSRSETSGSSHSEAHSSTIHVGNISNKNAINNMEPPNYMDHHRDIIKRQKRRKNYPKQRKNKGSKRKKLRELETKLLQNDDEIKMKVGDGLTPWDRFLDLMTPSFCSCSPKTNQIQQKTVSE